MHKAIRVFVTEGCNASCKNCFNSSIRGCQEIAPNRFEELCKYLVSSGFTSLKMMGGEPTVHTQFQTIYQISKAYFKNVALFTNSLNDEVCHIEPREKDTIIYNMNFEKTLTKEKLLIEKKGRRTLKYQITDHTDEKELINSITNWKKIDNRVKPSFTFDCVSNIFEQKDILQSKIVFLEKELNSLQIEYGFDHRVPVCFLLGCKEKLSYPSGCCKVENSGLIDSSLNIRYCNQNHNSIISLINSNGEFKSWNIIENYLLKYYYQQQLEILKGKCIDCELYGDICNGGCWGTKNSDYVVPQTISV